MSNISDASCSGHCCCNTDSSVSKNGMDRKKIIPPVFSFCLLLAGVLIDHFTNIIFPEYFRVIWYILAYLPVGFPVIKEAFTLLLKKDFFNEFTLMVIATLGAFFLGEYPEGVAVMLFYTVGELFQESAVNKAKGNIKALLDIRPDVASVLHDGKFETVSPENVNIGDIIQVKVGEKVPLDGVMLSSESSFNTSALTGESIPQTIKKGNTVLAGMLNLDKVIEIQVEKKYSDSSLSRILEMVQNASSRKAKTELLIRKFAKIYTPVVFFLALSITVIPYFFVTAYVFETWLYRALVFLVISCPCALVISIPLGYFGGIGAASRSGILFKGANYLDIMTSVNTIVMDKTGTLTKGVFKVRDIVAVSGDKKSLIEMLAEVERKSNHPVAKAITEYIPYNEQKHVFNIEDTEEIAGYGMKATVNGQEVLIGNGKLLKKYAIEYDKKIDLIVDTVVIVAIDQKYAGYVTISDEIKPDSKAAIEEMYKQGIRRTVMLSGDKTSIVKEIAEKLKISEAHGDLLPEDKVRHLENLKVDQSNIIAFVGDGINDAPVLALSDVGIAMGGMGSDAAIEVADVVIQTDQPSKIATAIKIAKATKHIVIQNIVLAFTIKILVLSLGAIGIATMWEAVFADVGVALLAILNAVRILKKKFD